MDLLSAYKKINDLPLMKCGKPNELERKSCNEPKQAWSLFADASPVEGWFQCQSGQQVFNSLPEKPDWGHLLAAEAINAEGHSITLRYDGAGQWILIIENTVEAEEDGWLYDEVEQLIQGETGKLCYRRYWQDKGGHGVRQVKASFIGLKEGEKKESNDE